MYHRWADKVLTSYRLGFSNLVKVFVYKFKVKSGYYRLRLPCGQWMANDLSRCFVSGKHNVLLAQIDRVSPEYIHHIMAGRWCFYFYHWFDMGVLPAWNRCPFSNRDLEAIDCHWSCISLGDLPGIDIKNIWELSRFYWAPQLALAYRTSGNEEYLKRLNHVLSNWCLFNRPYVGYQWLCAQEVAIRLINFLLASYLVAGNYSSSSVIATQFVIKHVKRILLTMSYAEAQNNNHATSEAAALYFAGVWLSKVGEHDRLARLAIKKGTVNLVDKVKLLIAPDGTFSQYSFTYHRLLLDTLSLVVWVQKNAGMADFAAPFYDAYRRAFDWLLALVDSVSGKAPNIGANDGTMLFKFDSCDYRDFRSSLQLASVLLHKKRVYRDGVWDTNLAIFAPDYVSMPIIQPLLVARDFENGGFVKLVHDRGSLLLRYHRFCFRPSHADCFHVDLWINGANVFRDAGTFSYNLTAALDTNFKGTSAHNTIQIDEHDQMPLLSRFLWGSWVVVRGVVKKVASDKPPSFWRGWYQDYMGAVHLREVQMLSQGFVILDQLSNYKINAILRWHVCAGNWEKDDDGWSNGSVKVITYLNGKNVLPILDNAWISMYYQQKELGPVFQLSIMPPNAEVKTVILLQE